MIHNTNSHCFFPGFRAHCSCGWKSDVFHATKLGAEYDAAKHKQLAALRARGKDPETLRAHGNERRRTRGDRRHCDTILFGGVPMLVEHKQEPINPEVAERQRLTYQQIIDREA